MVRTTGYTCCAVAELVLAKQWQRAGVSPTRFERATFGLGNVVIRRHQNVSWRAKRKNCTG